MLIHYYTYKTERDRIEPNGHLVHMRGKTHERKTQIKKLLKRHELSTPRLIVVIKWTVNFDTGRMPKKVKGWEKTFPSAWPTAADRYLCLPEWCIDKKGHLTFFFINTIHQYSRHWSFSTYNEMKRSLTYSISFLRSWWIQTAQNPCRHTHWIKTLQS